MLIKKTIRPFTGTTNFNFSLATNDDYIGYQQEIEALTTSTGDDLINPIIDGDITRFVFASDLSNLIFKFKFYDDNSGTYLTNLNNSGLTDDDINKSKTTLLSSFFILDLYNSYDQNNQNKICTTYLTKINKSDVAGKSEYTINSTNKNQFSDWYVPNYFFDSETGETLSCYVKFSFYCGRTGNIVQFYNYENESLISSQKLFFNATLNLYNKTWVIDSNDTSVLNIMELKTAPSYTNKISDAVSKVENRIQNYPVGNTFQDGGYSTEE
jgi:hypothetical protein